MKRARVENNSIVDCKHSILIGLSDDKNATLPPMETVIRGNRIVSPKRAIVEARCGLEGITWSDNRFFGKSLGIPVVAGIEIGEPKVKPLKPIRRDEVGTEW